jgi:hypothetical protein
MQLNLSYIETIQERQARRVKLIYTLNLNVIYNGNGIRFLSPTQLIS